jgi:hypothetical protein
VSVPFEFASTPTNAQAGPILNDTIYFNGKIADHFTEIDEFGGSIGNPAGSEFDHAVSIPHSPPDSSALRAGTNTITVVSNLTFAKSNRSGVFHVTLGPVRATTVTEKSQFLPALPLPGLIGAVCIAGVVARAGRRR